MDFDLQLEASELGEVAFQRALTTRRESLLKRMAVCPPDLNEFLSLRAEAAVLQQMYKETRSLIELERANRNQRAIQAGNLPRR